VTDTDVPKRYALRLEYLLNRLNKSPATAAPQGDEPWT
jgi:hypothetical protein